jgi:hypothetical protein
MRAGVQKSVSQPQADRDQKTVHQVADLAGLQDERLGRGEVEAARGLSHPQVTLELRR